MKKLVIGVPTFRRPKGLLRTIESLISQKVTGLNYMIVVADNDSDLREGHGVVDELNSKGVNVELDVILVEDRGISSARNAIIEYALNKTDCIGVAMLDDDEFADSNWLQCLYDMHIESGADVVGGYTTPEFEQKEPKWAKELPVFYRKKKSQGLVELIESTCSVYIGAELLRKFPKERFDLEFGITGGGDKEFFLRLKKNGAKFAFTADARAFELYPPSRVNKKWAIKRAFRIGSTDMRVIKLHAKTSSKVLELAKALVAIIIFPLKYIVSIFSEKKRLTTLMQLSRAVGKLSIFTSFQYLEYKKSHGQ